MKKVLISPDGDKVVLTDDHDGKENSTIIQYEETNSSLNVQKSSFDKMMEEFEEQGFIEYFRK